MTIRVFAITAKSEASSSAVAAATAASQTQTKPAPPTPIPEDANTSATTTSSINPTTFAITGSRSSSVSEQSKEGKRFNFKTACTCSCLLHPAFDKIFSLHCSVQIITDPILHHTCMPSCILLHSLLQNNLLVVTVVLLKLRLQCGGVVASCTY